MIPFRLREVFVTFWFVVCCLSGHADPFVDQIVSAAIDRTTQSVSYDGSYQTIPYPGGDVPLNLGVCTDLIIRSYRAAGLDLQKEVHEDISKNFYVYPSARIWGMSRPDANIGHRRVPNLQVFFARKGRQLPITRNPDDYAVGDLVTWMLPGNLPHIGLVTNQTSAASGRPLIAHNIGSGPLLEDMLFDFKITGHYRYGTEHLNQAFSQDE